MSKLPKLNALFLAAVAAGSLLAVPAAAQSPWRDRAQSRDYDCMANGQTWRQGERLCLAGAQRLCGLSQNVASWRSTGQICEAAEVEKVKPTN